MLTIAMVKDGIMSQDLDHVFVAGMFRSAKLSVYRGSGCHIPRACDEGRRVRCGTTVNVQCEVDDVDVIIDARDADCKARSNHLGIQEELLAIWARCVFIDPREAQTLSEEGGD